MIYWNGFHILALLSQNMTVSHFIQVNSVFIIHTMNLKKNRLVEKLISWPMDARLAEYECALRVMQDFPVWLWQ